MKPLNFLCKKFTELAIISPVQSAQKPAGGDEFIPTRLSLLSRLKRWDDHGSWREFFDTYWKFLYCVAVKAGLSDEDAHRLLCDCHYNGTLTGRSAGRRIRALSRPGLWGRLAQVFA